MSLPRITDYEILEKLGVGSYATVYKARHKKQRTYHAIKYVEMSTLSQSSRDNLITEIRLLRDLKHKYIVTLQDFFWDDKNIYIVLEYCNAGNLSAFIRTKKALPESTCRYFLRQLTAAVQYMRSNDISHFDLKPQNLLLTRHANHVTLKVADFGFAQHLKLGEINQQLKGSPLYMAPEIVRKHQYDAKADLWSVGVILYECLFGKAPYSSRTIEELLMRIRKAEPIVLPPHARISNECHDLLRRLLAHEPAERISFADFFEHPFLDLKTFPSEQTLKKAVDLVTRAVEYDEKRDYKEAYYLYCSALQYFVPLITEESDASRRQELRNRALAYMKRAEEIKNVLIEDEYKMLAQRQQQQQQQQQQDQHEEKAKAATTPTADSNQSSRSRMIEMLEPDARYKQLFLLSNSSPSLKTGLEIGRKGELYLYERKLDAALEAYTSALGILVPFVNNEPKGERRNLLLQQLDFWIKEAESIKSILSAKNLDEEEQKMSTFYIPEIISPYGWHIGPHIYLFLCIVITLIKMV
ncbi:serine/threonine-protein kinase ULK3 isoform X1 [Drosophila grimshawi]|uniref:serine/threonine-protein kinase ULK3 isoform X1 n=1 Tax=Drosophila grimshawi TaxID=7222 RepID=UPI000C86FD6D|nr:serine/threonine-protein kinase ULK3 isoform X1 [Drosophila grimshawi]XP_043070214.1 serine/threonine-protein kinase ULK3 isoform X1 [Drosophila grimshawi]